MTKTTYETNESTLEAVLVPNYKLGVSPVDLSDLEPELTDEEDEIAKLRYNTPMKVPNLSQLEDSKVALRMTRAV